MTIKVRLSGDYCRKPGTFHEYQHYYTQGFRQIGGLDFNLEPALVKICFRLLDKKIRGAHRAWSIHNWLFSRHRAIEADHVGRYLFEVDAKPIRVALDAHDGWKIRDQQAYQWCDIYFKTNKWTNRSYPPNVYPLLNGNGLLNSRKITYLKHLRNREKEIDLIFITKIYASTRKEVFYNNIEHHVRLFEILASLDCSKILKAIIPPEYPYEKIRPYLDRLDRAGVPWSYSWEGMNSFEFWDHLAKSRIVFLRPGKHGCISWRMLDLLCMGACIVSDLSPYPNWPLPLVPELNFVHGGCGLGPDESLPPLECYNGIRYVIDRLLSDQARMNAIRGNNSDYFDRHGTPASVASYIIDTVKNWKNSQNPILR